jgi:uncharacterized surface protein with fasciclin (FAS1) repeats
MSLFLLQACDGSDGGSSAPASLDSKPVTIADWASGRADLTTLMAALRATGLDATLDDESASFTVFAPTNAAFEILGQSTIDALLADSETLSDILTYHVIADAVDASAAIASAGTTVTMVNGDAVGLSLDGDNLLVNTATVITTDFMTDNGIVHLIDAVLMPPAEKGQPTMNIVETALDAGSFTTLVAALQATGLDAALADEASTFTVFAPTDSAFELLGEDKVNYLLENPDVLTNVLLQHVVNAEVPSVTAFTLNGQQAETLSGAKLPVAINSATDMLTFGGSNVVVKDIFTTNGVIHVIDAVIIGEVSLPSYVSSIAEVAVTNGSFNTLVAALQATGLDAVLADESATFTVFAPTDAAFAQLGQDTINALLADPDALANILLYHVIADADIRANTAITVATSGDNKVAMANEQMAALSMADGSLYINKSVVSMADVVANNGVIHVIDQVIIPPTMKMDTDMSIVDVALSDDNFSTLVSALSAAGLVDTLADENATFTVFAPTNDAFAKIDSDVLSGLLADTDALTGILLKHVVSGAEIDSVSAYAANGAMVDSVGGDKLSVSLVNFTKTTNTAMDEVAYDSNNQMLVGGMNSAHPGMTLYVFDNDLGTSGSVCNEDCAANWPPVLVTDGMVDNIPGLSTVMRDDGTMQAAYLGRPLYFFAGDSMVGDMTGQGLNDLWWTVKQEQVSLQIQGSNVTTTDIYTSNGVIHVIDTVITQ